MTKKHKNKRPAPPPPSPPAPPAAEPQQEHRKFQRLLPLGLALLAAAVYAFSVKNGFVFFDDDKAILYNSALKNPSLGKFFSGQNLGMYAPMSWIAYWLGSAISGTDAWGYHLLGLLLHALNSALVFTILYRLFRRQWPAVFAAALFAVHPVQVEAVSWAAALSTVLFSSFYLLSFLAYLNWKRRPVPMHYSLALLAFALACLSKSAAVTLPLVLLAADAFEGNRWDWKFLWNKAPFFAFSLFFGAYTFVTRAQEGHDIEASSSVFSALDRFWMVSQTLLFYPVKILAPLGFSVAYPFVKSGGSWPWHYYVAPLALAGLAALVWLKFRQNREVLLALALYLLPLTVMLPFRTVGSFELRSDRYVYLSCIGLFLVLALALERLKPLARLGILAVLVVALGGLAVQQTRVWKDGIALFTNCVKKTPQAALCQCNLAYSELLSFRFDDAVAHYSAALSSDPSTVEAYNGRGQAYFQLKKIPEALDDFTKAIEAGLVSPKLFLNRGKCLVMLNRPQEALPNLNRSLELEPNAPEAYFFRAVVQEKTGAPDRAEADYSRAYALNPEYLEALVNRALVRMNKGALQEAIADYTQAISLRPNLVMLYNNRGYAHFKNGQIEQALQDVNQAIALDPNYARAYQTRAVIYQQTGRPAQAQADLLMLQRLQGR